MAKAKYAKHVSTKGPTPQREAIPGKDQVANNAGGFVFKVGDWAQLDRFLILGAEGGTYYVGERAMTKDNAKAVQACIAQDGVRVVNRIVEISDAGRAPKNDPSLFVLALCASSADIKTRQAAYAALPKIARIGTHLFTFAEMIETQRGWGRGLRRAVAQWYLTKRVDPLAMQLVKYPSRNGWSHRDMLRLAHPKASDAEHRALFDWACHGKTDSDVLHPLPRAFDALVKTPDAKVAIGLIRNLGLPREALPTEMLNDPDVWRALLDDMPITALIRNLGKLSAVGVLKPLAPEVVYAAARLTDETTMRKGRVHPLQYLLAQMTYAQGKGDKGSLTWTPVQQIVSALESGFYRAFKTVEPTGKAILLGLDISGSMDGNMIAGTKIDARAASAVMALVTMATEQNTHAIGFSSGGGGGMFGRLSASQARRGVVSGVVELQINPADKLDTVCRYLKRFPHGGTDCSLPMLYALKTGIRPDAFVIYTDNETWAGDMHASEALQKYRKETGINAKLVVVGMTSTGFTIADPNDAGMLDVVGFDANAPAMISDFIRG